MDPVTLNIMQKLSVYFLIGLCILLVFKKPFDKGMDEEEGEGYRTIVYVLFIIFWLPMIINAFISIFISNKKQ